MMHRCSVCFQLLITGSLTTVNWTNGLDTTGLFHAGFVFGVLEAKFKFLFFVLGAGFLSSHVNVGDIDDHENLNIQLYYSVCLLYRQLDHFIAMFCLSFTGPVEPVGQVGQMPDQYFSVVCIIHFFLLPRPKIMKFILHMWAGKSCNEY